MAGGVINLGMQVIRVGQGLLLTGDTLSAPPGTAIEAFVTKTDNYTITTSDYGVEFTGTTAKTFTLPIASGNTGQVFLLKNRGSAELTVDVTSAGSLWTTAATTSMALSVGESMLVVSDNQFWAVAAMASGIIVP